MRTSRRILGVLVAVLLGAAGWGAEVKPPAKMPSEVTLASGRVLRRVQVEKWEKTRVVLRHAGGVEPIPFALIKVPGAEELKAIQESSNIAPALRRISGQVFIVTKGQTTYKLGGVRVQFVPREEMDAFLGREFPREYEESMTKETGNRLYDVILRRQAEGILHEHFKGAPAGIAAGQTDADGRYLAQVPAGREVYAFVRAERAVGQNLEWYLLLRLLAAEDTEVNLSNQDLWQPKRGG